MMSKNTDFVAINEVVLRDGFQNEPDFVPTEKKIRLSDRLSATGVRRIEVSSFVSPKAIPNLRDAAEVFSAGVGLVRGVVALPDARSRLDLDNRTRMATLARRFAPAACLVLDAGTRVDLGPDGALPEDAPVLRPDGTVRPGGPV